MAAPADAPVERRARPRLAAATGSADAGMWKYVELDELNASYLKFQVLAGAARPKVALSEGATRLANKMALDFGGVWASADLAKQHALSIVALCVDLGMAWGPKSDFPLALVVGCFAGASFALAPAMAAAKFAPREAAKAEVKRAWASVTPFLKNFQEWANFAPVEDFEQRS
ncbi:unnamed protein product, partial [Prorocentrum cordatum]